MTNYRRNWVNGGCYFFTVNLNDRNSNILVAEVSTLREAVRATLARHPFHIDAWVVLPDHMHCIWTLPPNDHHFPIRWQMIKTTFSSAVARPEPRRASLIRKRETGLWQRRYWEHTIRNDEDYAAHMDYVHFNPVKHKLAAHPADWPFSSFARSVKRGMYPTNWAPEAPDLPTAGERPQHVAVNRRPPTQSNQVSKKAPL